jgi:pyruvate/2-oxoglutarate dehydrogenase complex dihydrolipoamide dehydrogenase (E3) component
MSVSDQNQSGANGRNEFDVIVLGVGTCGEDLSLRLLGAGLSVLGIEASLVGGECAYWACLPSKAIIRAANLLQEARRVAGKSGEVDVTPDWHVVADRVRTEVAGGWDDSGAVKRYTDRGGRLVHGRGKLTGPRSVTVGDETYTARRAIVIATGSRPFIPPIPGLADVAYWTTHDVIQAEPLPKSLVVLGGGAVGCELSQALARFGVDVTIVEAAGRLMAAEEPEASQVVEAAFAAEGIDARTRVAAERVAMRDGAISLQLNSGEEVSAEGLLVATGRTVGLSGVGLETAGIDATERFLPVDERMRAADGVYAMGDVTGKAMFTHVALYQSALIAAEILGEDRPPARYDAVPRVTFTDPEVGAVGLTETQAAEAGIDAAVVVKQTPATFRGWLHGAQHGVIKLVMDCSTATLVGATVAGPHGGDTLSMLSLAVHARIPLTDLRSMIYAFPTFHGGIGEAIGAYGRGLVTVLDPEYEGIALLDEALAAV